MLRRLYLITSLMAVAITLAGLMPPATALPDLPDCARFAGKDGMTTYQNTLMLTYLKAAGNMGQVIYAVSTDNGVSFSSTIVDSDTLADYVSAPVIQSDNYGVTIAFSRDGKTLSKYKPVAASEFIAEPGVVSEYADPLPLLWLRFQAYTEAITYQADNLSAVNNTNVANTSISTENTPVFYDGTYQCWNKIHSNGDIYIKQGGGGNNNGWPVFHAVVTTSGTIQFLSPDAPIEQIFLSGYQEHAPIATINEGIPANLRERATPVGGTDDDPNRIIFVTVNGSSYTTWVGYVIETGVDSIGVYTDYPPAEGEYLFRNRIVHRDTIWAQGPSGGSLGMSMVFGQLWIRGSFVGTQIWGATGDITIVDNIGLYNTPLGQSPGGDEINPENRTDFVALVSEKNIKVQYGYRDPADSLRRYPNMPDVYIYASLFALGDGNGNPGGDGNISFEYQHPHPSTPAVNIDGTVWDNIDLHRHRYFPTAQDPWESGLDYPYYNPLWPESHPYLERGTVHIYGSLYQRRQGFWHLPLNQEDNPQNLWDIENQQYGGNSGTAVIDPILGVTMQCVNYPGTVGDGIGYSNVLLHGDTRLENVSYMGLVSGMGIRISYYSSIDDNWHCRNSFFENEVQHSKTADYGSFAFNNKVWTFFTSGLGIQSVALPPGNVCQLSSPTYNHVLARHYNPDGDTLSIFRVNPVNFTYELLCQLPTNNSLSYLLPSQDYLAVMQPDGRIFFYRKSAGTANGFYLYYTWSPQIAGLNVSNLDNAESHLVISGTQDSLLAFIYIRNTGESTGTFYRAQGSIENVLNEDDNLTARLDISAFPNPFRQSLSIRVSSDKQTKADMAIYNLKGQKVAVICKDTLLSKGVSTLEWDGKDTNGNEAGTGLYFLKSKTGNETQLVKVLKIK